MQFYFTFAYENSELSLELIFDIFDLDLCISRGGLYADARYLPKIMVHKIWSCLNTYSDNFSDCRNSA